MMKNRKNNIIRSFPPGSNWIYFKFYTGYKYSDNILVNKLFPIITKLKKEKKINKFFFVRYSDPDYHLRIRIYVLDINDIGYIMQLFYIKTYHFMSQALIWKIQLDTYHRELERYNYLLIEDIEHLFSIDSEFTIKILNQVQGNEDYKWMVSLLIIDTTLSSFFPLIDTKKKLIEHMSNHYKTTFNFDEHNSKQFNMKYREYTKIINDILDRNYLNKDFIYCYKLIDIRSKNSTKTIEQIKKKCYENKLSEKNIVFDLIHMSMNRIFPSKNNLHELILYDFVKRYYTSFIARSKHNKNQ